MDIQQSIRPISDLRHSAAEIMKYAEESQRPVAITKNGRVRSVLIDCDAYQKMLDDQETMAVLHSIRRGMDDIENGRYLPADEFFSKFEKENGIRI
ncbi:MAG: type II toxin-antitoxin system Phd/YefM family antitoxin [Rickettsiales bacterium]|jgi:prevent-host-death family protein|nr:type II toxin-antitoxin system Phd/YefM family antitoxin [Rickettsiales bacterium]